MHAHMLQFLHKKPFPLRPQGNNSWDITKYHLLVSCFDPKLSGNANYICHIYHWLVYEFHIPPVLGEFQCFLHFFLRLHCNILQIELRKLLWIFCLAANGPIIKQLNSQGYGWEDKMEDIHFVDRWIFVSSMECKTPVNLGSWHTPATGSDKKAFEICFVAWKKNKAEKS